MIGSLPVTSSGVAEKGRIMGQIITFAQVDGIPAADILWVIVASALVFLMQAGFLGLEAGLTRAKNAINVAIKNLADFGVSVIVFWLVGFGIMFGVTANGWFGADNFALSFGESTTGATVFFVFQVMFAGTAVTILSGAVAERLRFLGYIFLAVFMAGLTYPVFGHWAWNSGGWLAELGFVDFAGSTVVHSVGGWTALAVLLVIGPRLGRFPKDGPPRKIQGSNLPLASFGVLLLFIGWLGFNGGSTLAIDASVGRVIANTLLAGAAGMVAATLLGYRVDGRAEIDHVFNGVLGGLVAITANAHAVDSVAAVVIGALGGVVAIGAMALLERFRIDDAVGAVPVHLAAGIWGTLATGIFGEADLLGTGLGRFEQIGIQTLGIAACFVWVFITTYLIVRAIDHFKPFRVTEEAELVGLNVSEHGATTELLDFFRVMDTQAATGDLSLRAPVEPFTEVGQIATQYNVMMGQLEESDTELREYQAHLEDLVDAKTGELREANAQEHDQRVLAEALAEVSAALTSTLELDEVLDLILDRVARVVPYPAGTVLLIKGDHAEVVRARGYDESMVGVRLPLTNLVGLMTEAGQPRVIHDTHEVPDWIVTEAGKDIRSVAMVGIQVDGQVVGFISLDSNEIGYFTLGQAARLQAFADQAGNAIRNARLYRETEMAAAKARDTTAQLGLALEQLESTDTIIERWTLDGIVLDMNQFGLDLFGFSADEIIGRDGNDSFRIPGGGWEDEREKLLANPGQSVDSELECRRSDGTSIWVAWRNSPILDEDNNIVEVVSIGIDITERRAMEMQVKAARDRMEGELNVAAEIQMSMLPLEFPAFPDRREFSIHAMLQPAREVGGDFYDFFLIDHDHLCFCVGDVSDKGVPAALFMAVTKTLIESHAANDRSPASIMTAVNNELCVHNESSMFVTIFLCILDLRTGELVYTNAGHNPPYVKTGDGELITLDERHGLVAGAVAGVAYGEDRKRLAPGDYMILFTDGVTEAMSPEHELYSDEALERLLAESTMLSTEQGVGLIYDSVVAHQGSATQSDDITILTLAFEGVSDTEIARLEVVVVNTLEDIGAALGSVGDFAKTNDLADDIRRPVLLAVDDLLNNIVSYAYQDEDAHEISVSVRLSSSRVSVSVSDDGIPFNPFGAEVPNISTPLEGREVGGLGIHLVRTLMDEYRYERRSGRNIVTIAKNLEQDTDERTHDGNHE